MTVDELKLYIRVDSTDEDDLIQAFLTAATEYIEKTTGKTYDSTKEVWNLAIKIMASHWYDNRGVEATGINVSKYSYSAESLINHIALCGEYT